MNIGRWVADGGRYTVSIVKDSLNAAFGGMGHGGYDRRQMGSGLLLWIVSTIPLFYGMALFR